MDKIVLTGGPGSGKSSLLLTLEKEGEYIIREAAEDHIKYMQAKGCKEPWKDPDFQKDILELQILRESKVPDSAKRVFIDRGLYDGLAYVDKGSELYRKILDEASKMEYEKIFLVESLDTVVNTGVRREDYSEAIELGKKLEDIYKEVGYEIIKVPATTIESRLDVIKQCL